MEQTVVWSCRNEIEGETVTALDDYAFARNLEVEEIWLPEALKESRSLRILPVRNLKKLILGNQLLDMGGGALTGCRLTEVEIYFREGKKKLSKIHCGRDALSDPCKSVWIQLAI